MEQLPVSVITGFLGSGKTTLLSRLLADSRLANAAVIINEFGEIPLDHLLVARPQEDILLLSNGCLCCEVRGELVETLTSLYARRQAGEIPAFDRVLVETSGLAEPAPILLSVTADAALSRCYRLERILTTVDAVHGLGQIDRHGESRKQVCVADCLILTKTDIARASDVAGLRARLKALNPFVEIAEAASGRIDPALLFPLAADGDVRRGALSGIGDLPGRDHDEHVAHAHHEGHAHDHDHGHDGGVQSFSLAFDEPVTAAGLQLWMGMLADFHGPSLLRIKGLLNLEGRPVVLHAVQHLFHPLVELDAWPDGRRSSRLVLITQGIPKIAIERTLAALTFEAPKASAGQFDLEAYRRFTELARTMS